MDSRVRGLKTGDTLRPTRARGCLRERRPPNAVPPQPGMGTAGPLGTNGCQAVMNEVFREERTCVSRIFQRDCRHPAHRSAQRRDRVAATPDGAAGAGCFHSSRLGPAGFPLRHWHGRMFRKGKCTSHPKWLPHLKPNPSRGPPREPGSPHAHRRAALPYTFTVLHIHTGRQNTQTHNTGMKTPAKRAWRDISHQPPGFVVKAPGRPDQRQEASGLSSSHTSASKGTSPQACVLCSGQVLGAQLPASTWGPVVDSKITQKGLGGHSGSS